MHRAGKGYSDESPLKILSLSEYIFLEDWIHEDISAYKPSYANTLNYRILKTHKASTRFVRLVESNDLKKIDKGL